MDPNCQGRLGRTPLLLSCDNKNIEITKLLLRKYHANPDIKDGNDYTPLHLAAIYNNEELVKLLLDNGAKSEVQNIWNEKPIDLTNNQKIQDILSPKKDTPQKK